MLYFCPICGYFSPDNEIHPKLNPDHKYCYDPHHFYTKEEREKIKMLPVTTKNLFCGWCNKIFPEDVGWEMCPICFRQPLSRITESHLKDNIILLSGTAAKKIWEP